MPGKWADSSRRARLPDDWPRRVAFVKARSGNRCEKIRNGKRCNRRANGGVDHKNRFGGDDLDNLEDTCWPCHREKSSREGNEERAAIRARAKRGEERHPGDRT